MEKSANTAHDDGKELKAGRIVLLMYPYHDSTQADREHPALVLDAEGSQVYVAFGTSAHVDELARRPTTVSIVDPSDLATASLHKPTAFRLDKRARVDVSKIKYRLGELPSHKYQQLHRAVVAAGLLRA